MRQQLKQYTNLLHNIEQQSLFIENKKLILYYNGIAYHRTANSIKELKESARKVLSESAEEASADQAARTTDNKKQQISESGAQQPLKEATQQCSVYRTSKSMRIRLKIHISMRQTESLFSSIMLGTFLFILSHFEVDKKVGFCCY